MTPGPPGTGVTGPVVFVTWVMTPVVLVIGYLLIGVEAVLSRELRIGPTSISRRTRAACSDSTAARKSAGSSGAPEEVTVRP